MKKLELLQMPDFITVGIYTAVYFIVIFAVSMIGIIPIFYVFLSVLVALIAGIPFILFLSKVKRFGMITLMAAIIGVLVSLTGYSFSLFFFALIFGLIADIIFNLMPKTKTAYVTAYTIFNLWMIGYYYPIFIANEKYFDYTRETSGVEYANQLESLLPSWTLIPIIIGTAIAAIIGGVIGTRALRKHFNKAGV